MSAPDVVQQAFAQSRLGRASQVILDDLREVTEGGDYVAALTDETVTITWLAGDRRMRRCAEDVHFTLGGCWSEEAVGTNALALAHTLERPASVFSAEHYAPMVHDWVCYSAPILDPRTGHSLGVIDVSSLWSRWNPSVLTMVRALARNVEYELARDGTTYAVTPGAVDDAHLRVRVLGAPGVWLNGTPVKLSPRQLEIVALLALYEGGLSLDQLTAFLYGDHPVAVSTLKAEVSHLRRLLGDVIASRPYRLGARVDADNVTVRNALRHGDLATAVRAYGGTLLANSESPELTMTRHHLDVALHEAVERRDDPELLFKLSNVDPGDERLAARAAASMKDGDVRRSLSAARAERS